MINCLAALAAGEQAGRDPKALWRRGLRLCTVEQPWMPWGNDHEATDRWGMELARRRQRVFSQMAKEFKVPAVVGCHVVRSLHYCDGQHLPATIDGRKDGDPLADSLAAKVGTAQHGPTAELMSVARLPRQQFLGLSNVNLTLPRAQAAPTVIDALLTGFFLEGGQEVQVNVLCSQQLRQANRTQLPLSLSSCALLD